MKKTILLICTAIITLNVSAQKKGAYSDAMKADDVAAVTNAVLHKQIGLYPVMNRYRNNTTAGRGPESWENAVFISAVASWVNYEQEKMATKWVDSICKSTYYQPHKFRMYHADDIAISLAYGELYRRTFNKESINPSIARLDFIVNHPSDAIMKWGGNSNERWNWCDALYMAPPVFAQYANLMGENRYRVFMDREFEATYNHLYDKEEHLFFRDARYFEQKEKNGKKVFWGRGNGWVIAGLTHIIDELPDSYPTKPFYVELYVEMIDRLVELQNEDGYWRASLLDPASYPNPETSSSAFITYSIWWGINSGIIKGDKYLNAANKGWQVLVAAVHPDGMLGFVQPIGADPQRVTSEMTETYGAAAFVRCGMEVLKYIRN